MENATQTKNKIVELYPMTKFYLAIATAIIAVVLPGILSKVICFLTLNILAFVSGVYPVFIKRVRNSVGILFLVLLIVQTFFAPGETVIFSFWIFKAKLEGLLAHMCHSKFNNFVPLLPVLLPVRLFPGKKFFRHIAAIQFRVVLHGCRHGVFLSHLYPEILGGLGAI